jgi:hypothetical protein
VWLASSEPVSGLKSFPQRAHCLDMFFKFPERECYKGKLFLEKNMRKIILVLFLACASKAARFFVEGKAKS